MFRLTCLLPFLGIRVCKAFRKVVGSTSLDNFSVSLTLHIKMIYPNLLR